jgi:hypothetical protein
MSRPIKCSRTAYTKSKAGKLYIPAQAVVDGLSLHSALFPSPPVDPATFTALITAYSNTYSTYKAGGMAQKPAYQQAMAALLNAMDATATYVDGIANGDPNIIMFAGFVPTKGTASNTPLPTLATGLQAWRGATGELFFECDKQDFADTYGAILTEGAPLPPEINITASGQIIISDTKPTPPPPPPGGELPPPPAMSSYAAIASSPVRMAGFDLNKARRKRFLALRPGSNYFCTFYIVNASGVSQLCPPVSIQCW